MSFCHFGAAKPPDSAKHSVSGSRSPPTVRASAKRNRRSRPRRFSEACTRQVRPPRRHVQMMVETVALPPAIISRSCRRCQNIGRARQFFSATSASRGRTGYRHVGWTNALMQETMARLNPANRARLELAEVENNRQKPPARASSSRNGGHSANIDNQARPSSDYRQSRFPA